MKVLKYIQELPLLQKIIFRYVLWTNLL